MRAMRKRLCAIVLSVFILAMPSTTAFMEETAEEAIVSLETTSLSKETISENDLDAILRAGASANSDNLEKPWYFVVVTNRDLLETLANNSDNDTNNTPSTSGVQTVEIDLSKEVPKEARAVIEETEEQISTSTAKLDDAPVAIIIYRDSSTASINADVDCGLACQSMAIMAESLGYSTQTLLSATAELNGANQTLLCERFGIDSSMQAEAILLIDYPEERSANSYNNQTQEWMNTHIRYVQ